MIEGRIRPHNRVVALRAKRSRKTRRDVVRNRAAESRRAVPCCLVAPVAIGVRGREGVVVVDVAVGAGIHFSCRCQLVRSHERPPRRSMVERDVSPQGRAVAGRAVPYGKGCASRRVHRIVCSVVGRQVALRIAAIIRLNRQCAVVSDVALIAPGNLTGWCNLVRIRQGETRVGMVKRRVRPDNRVVALAAQGSRETCRNVVRNRAAKCGCAVPGRLMATVTIGVGVCEGIVVVDVAVGAGIHFSCRRQLVRSRKRPTRRSMVERYIGPQRRRMAGGTI